MTQRGVCTWALGATLALGGGSGCSSKAHAESGAPEEAAKVEVAEVEAATIAPGGEVAPRGLPGGEDRCPAGMAFVAGGTVVHLESTPDTSVSGVCLDVLEVSVADFRACVERGDCLRECADPASCPAVPTKTDWGNPREDDDISFLCNGRKTGVDDHPINCVSPGEARSYCASQGRRLPTGDEWEWAARGAHESPWGTRVATDEICWGRPRKRAGTCARGAHPRDATPDGVLDLGGNVTEWTEPPARAGAGARFAYGASWYARDDGYAMAALGGVGMPARRAETVGFRCAATPGAGAARSARPQ